MWVSPDDSFICTMFRHDCICAIHVYIIFYMCSSYFLWKPNNWLSYCDLVFSPLRVTCFLIGTLQICWTAACRVINQVWIWKLDCGTSYTIKFYPSYWEGFQRSSQFVSPRLVLKVGYRNKDNPISNPFRISHYKSYYIAMMSLSKCLSLSIVFAHNDIPCTGVP